MTLDQGWTNTIDGALGNAAWDAYDSVIKTEVDDHRRRLGCVVDWTLFKAVLWTENGGPSHDAWTTRPMQIGNPGDAGYDTMKRGAENSAIVMSDALKRAVASTSINEPVFNVKLGIACAITRIATFGTRVTDPTIREYVVKSGDNLSVIASRNGTTLQNLTTLNPGLSPTRMQIGQKIKYQKASIQVTACQITPELLQTKYNNHPGEPYAEKLRYCLDVIGRIKR